MVTEFAMKHWSWARWCIWSNVAASGSAPRKTIRGERMTVDCHPARLVLGHHADRMVVVLTMSVFAMAKNPACAAIP